MIKSAGEIGLSRIEEALKAGHMKACMTNGHFWLLRRNGKTQLWKTRPGKFRIPVKAGLNACSAITEDSRIGRPGDGNNCDFQLNSMI